MSVITVIEGQRENAFKITIEFLRAINVRVSKLTVRNALFEHPEFPNLLSVSDVISGWEVQNSAHYIQDKSSGINAITFPVIAEVNESGGRLVLLHDVKAGFVTIHDGKMPKRKVLLDDFLDSWTGVLLQATSNKVSVEKSFMVNNVVHFFGQFRHYLLAAFTLLFTIILLNGYLKELANQIFFVALVLGMVINMLILIQSVSSNNQLFKKICSLLKKNNCDTLLNSKAAYLTPWLSWSEVGFFYFCGSVVSLLLGSDTIPFLIWLNLFTLPYVVFSIHFQYIKNTWCVLCCCIQLVLVAQFIINLAFFQDVYYNMQWLNLTSLFKVTIGFSLPVSAWASIKPMINKSSEWQKLKDDVATFKYNHELFRKSLTSQPFIAIPDDIRPIVLGKKNAHTVITMVTNPFCSPCALAHKELSKLISVREDIALKIVFTSAGEDNDAKAKVSKHSISLNLSLGSNLTGKALDEWYEQPIKKFEKWADRYPAEINGDTNTIADKQVAWGKLAGVTYTPTFFIDGYRLPEAYKVEDIKFLLP